MSAEPFLPTNNPVVLQLLRVAAQRNRARDDMDERGGGQAVALQPLSLQVRTAISALVAALELHVQDPHGPEGWDEVAEAVAILCCAEVPLRELEKKADIRLKAPPGGR